MILSILRLIISMSIMTTYSGSTLAADFVAYDAIQHRDKPDLKPLGFEPLQITYETQFWPKKADRTNPDIDFLKRYSKSIIDGPKTVCLDIEHWVLGTQDSKLLSDNITKLLTVLEHSRANNSDKRFGYYGILPIRDYWTPINNRKSEIVKWQKQNLQVSDLANAVDVIFPSLYTFYNNREHWISYAIANINEAKKYGKPVYAFLWPQYHQSNLLGGLKYIDGDFWRLQLETVKKHADGVVIWSPRGEAIRSDWDENADWWKQTKLFMKRHKMYVNPIYPEFTVD